MTEELGLTMNNSLTYTKVSAVNGKVVERMNNTIFKAKLWSGAGATPRPVSVGSLGDGGKLEGLLITNTDTAAHFIRIYDKAGDIFDGYIPLGSTAYYPLPSRRYFAPIVIAQVDPSVAPAAAWSMGVIGFGLEAPAGSGLSPWVTSGGLNNSLPFFFEQTGAGIILGVAAGMLTESEPNGIHRRQYDFTNFYQARVSTNLGAIAPNFLVIVEYSLDAGVTWAEMARVDCGAPGSVSGGLYNGVWSDIPDAAKADVLIRVGASIKVGIGVFVMVNPRLEVR